MSPGQIIGWTALVVLAVVAVAVGLVWLVYDLSRPRAAEIAEQQELKKAIASMMSDLTPAQLEAATIFAWAHKDGWRQVNRRYRNRENLDGWRYVEMEIAGPPPSARTS